MSSRTVITRLTLPGQGNSPEQSQLLKKIHPQELGHPQDPGLPIVPSQSITFQGQEGKADTTSIKSPVVICLHQSPVTLGFQPQLVITDLQSSPFISSHQLSLKVSSHQSQRTCCRGNQVFSICGSLVTIFFSSSVAELPQSSIPGSLETPTLVELFQLSVDSQFKSPVTKVSAPGPFESHLHKLSEF